MAGAVVLAGAAAFLPLPTLVRTVGFAAAYLLAGGGVLADSWRNIRRGEIFDENFLMSIASIGAFAIGEQAEAVAVMVFYGIGEMLQDSAVAKSRRNIEELMDLRSDRASVRRDGRMEELPPEEVCPGEIIVVNPGGKVPLDGVVESGSAHLDTRALTGEPVPRRTGPGDEVLSGTIVTDAVLEIRVTRPFAQSTVSRILELVRNAAEKKSSTERFITRFARYYTPAAVGLAVLVATLPPLAGFGTFPEWLYKGLSFLIISCPCALVLSIPLGFFGGIGGAARAGVLVKGGNYLELLGRIGTIAFDKTGTLTQNRMQVSEIVYEGDKNLLCESIAANSTAHLEKENHYRGVGNPTECALLLWMHGEGVDYSVLRAEAGVVNQLTFSTERKYMATLVESRVLGRRALFVKGAPEIVAGLCNISQQQKDELSARLKKYQSQAMRTLAFAYKEVPAGNDDAEALAKAGGLTYMGVAAINDPVRDEVPAAIESCKRAGIQVKVVTGDTAGTAIEIARRIGLWTAEDTAENTISGPEFAALSDEEASERAARLKVMSRARPLDKQRLVQLLQKRGEVVAVTGDGTNDAPALNFADVGLSMGSGTSVAKEASDITLLDDSFASIETAVMWGRSLYKNIQRFVMFQLTINFVALAVVLVGAVIGTTLPLTVTQMLWVNLIMDTFAAMALASLPPSRRVMNEKPRKTSDFIITPRMAKHLLFTSLAFVAILLTMLVMIEKDGDISIKSLSMFFTTFVMLQFWNLLNMKAFDSSNLAFHKLLQCRGLLIVLAIIFAGQVIIVEFGGKVFRTCHLNFSVWLQIFLATSLIFLIPEIVKAISRQIKRSMSRK